MLQDFIGLSLKQSRDSICFSTSVPSTTLLCGEKEFVTISLSVYPQLCLYVYTYIDCNVYTHPNATYCLSIHVEGLSVI